MNVLKAQRLWDYRWRGASKKRTDEKIEANTWFMLQRNINKILA